MVTSRRSLWGGLCAFWSLSGLPKGRRREWVTGLTRARGVGIPAEWVLGGLGLCLNFLSAAASKLQASLAGLR
jgi:hypothetical protein